ncbi:ABC transporter substrate-binding protein [Thermosipho atlanticus]|uniref:NitT/TauT family transport system substrate-binding protein n=1 Tax=Thermosipho atlanticus DSM 15807 TaxID=1123380 RepID=A0A1M5TKD0_9BACT|nr:ABC transporter substrate-binding protein [Thermosipho atlanticus]SHH51120.1 NitT/TauT family transport system substrate-binding protein [Thermosipho atlanticus DSM 15807]
MKKYFIFFLIVFISYFSFSLTFINPFGPTIVPITPMLEGIVKGYVNLNIELWRTPDEAIAKIVSNYAKFAVLPITIAANLYTKGINIKLVGVHEWKVFYLVAKKDINSLSDLKGKTVYSAHGRGQTVDVLLRYLLVSNGLIPDKDVKFAYAPPQEIVALFKAGKVEFAALPEPFVSMCLVNDGKIVLDFQKEWNKISGSQNGIPIAGLFVVGDIAQYKNLIEDVENTFKESINWSNKNLEKTLEFTSKYLTIPTPILKNAMQRIEFRYVPISECKNDVNKFLSTMNELYPEGLPKVPNEEFYLK